MSDLAIGAWERAIELGLFEAMEGGRCIIIDSRPGEMSEMGYYRMEIGG